jgi:hypothetical protein
MKLAPAGSGLPNVERLFIKNLLVPTIRIFITWDIALFLLKRELKIIDKILKPINKDLLTKQIIIEWSVFMYMHTFIHRRQIEAII